LHFTQSSTERYRKLDNDNRHQFGVTPRKPVIRSTVSFVVIDCADFTALQFEAEAKSPAVIEKTQIKLLFHKAQLSAVFLCFFLMQSSMIT
jgi:hypothetical protein